jgi:hypothetical protein
MKVVKSFVVVFILLSCFLFTACLSDDKRAEYSPDKLFLDYSVTSSEEDSLVNILLHFRDAGEGDPLLLPMPANVQLDGKLLQPDSAKIGGYFYETFRPVSGFSGKHAIVYTDTKNRVYRAEFTFQPMKMVNDLPDTLDGNELDIQFTGIGSKDQLYVIYRDTSAINDDSRRNAEPGEKSIRLVQPDFESLFDGPVQMEFIRETIIPVNPVAPGGGQLYLSYLIRKEFVLKKSIP